MIELYDLQSDPYETNNLAGVESVKAIETELREQLEAWMIREHDFLPLPSHALQNEEEVISDCGRTDRRLQWPDDSLSLRPVVTGRFVFAFGVGPRTTSNHQTLFRTTKGICR